MKRISILIVTCILSVSCTDRDQKYKDRSSEPLVGFEFQKHCDITYDNALLKDAFDKYGPGKYKKWQKTLRKDLKEILGLNVIEGQLKDFKPVTRKIAEEDIGFASRQRWEIWTEPDVNIPFILIIPKERKEKTPLILTPHGHNRNLEVYAGIYESEKDSTDAWKMDRNPAFRFAQEGFITLLPTARGYGSTMYPEDLADGKRWSCRELLMRDLLVGRTPVGDRCWDLMKILDWALENLPIDPKNIIVTGNSGGGTQAEYWSALDERVTMSIPGSAFSSMAASWGSVHHCECGYIPGILNYCELGDLAGLTAPRKICILQGTDDHISLTKQAKEQFLTTKRIYEAAGAPDNCSLIVKEGGHRYFFDDALEYVKANLAD